MSATTSPIDRQATERSLMEVLLQLGMTLSTPVERSAIAFGDGEWSGSMEDVVSLFSSSAGQIGFQVQSLEPESFRHATDLLAEGYPIVSVEADGRFGILEQGPGRRVETTRFQGGVADTNFQSRRAFDRWSDNEYGLQLLVVRKELECEPLSVSGGRAVRGASTAEADGATSPNAVGEVSGVAAV